ncbi:MAG: DsbC family protein [Wenzhouxiangella sp.]
MKASFRTLIASLFLILSSAAAADDFSAIQERLAGLVPNVGDLVIAETPMPGLVQVRIGGDIIYMSSDGRYLFQGRVIDLETQRDLTEAAMSAVRKEQLQALDRAEFVTFGPADAEFELLVFTDPDCGFCRRMHEKIDEYNALGITIHYLAFPRAGRGSSTYNNMVSIWCAENRQDAMDIAKLGRTPRAATCDNPVMDQYQLGQSLGVTGTPSLMTFDGDIIPGYVPPEQLRERLERYAAANGSR